MIERSKYRESLDNDGSSWFAATYLAQLGSVWPQQVISTVHFEAIIDSGASRCIFHADFASHLGFELREGVRESTHGIGGKEDYWLHDVMLTIPGGPVKIRAGFMERLPVAGLLGTQGFFEHLTVTFDASARECSLERIYRI